MRAVAVVAAAMLVAAGAARGADSPSAAADAATVPFSPRADEWLKAQATVAPDPVPRGEPFRVTVTLDIADPYHVNANPPTLDFQIPTAVEPQPNPAVEWGSVEYPPGKPLEVSWSPAMPIAVYGGRTEITVLARAAADAPLGETPLELTLRYQGCDEDTCYQPAERVLSASVRIVEATSGAAMSSPEAAAPAQPPVRFEDEADIAGWYGQGFAAYLALLVLGGLGLNLTPCVFPLIPVTMNVFAQQGRRHWLRVLPLAAVYALGLALTFTLVGMLAALAGRSLGLVLQSPWGVLGLIAVLAVMMASAFGAFDIQLPPGVMGRLGARRGFLGAGFMGMVMGAIAAPCVGPFLIALIAFVATTGSLALGAVSFFAVGLGLGLPYIVLGTATSLINRFPRGGGWLIWTKRVLGMTLAGLILYFLQPYILPDLFWPLVLLAFVFAAVYLGLLEGLSRRPFTRRFWAVRGVTAVAIFVFGVWFYAAYAPRTPSPSGPPTVTAEAEGVQWAPWSEGDLAAAAREGRPVLLYFGADWCAECHEWKRLVFAEPAVVRQSEAFRRLYVDVTRPPEGARLALSEKFRGTNPPAVILFDAKGRVVKAYRSVPSAPAFLEAMREASAGG